ncbi:hypothetical protein [Mucilaginibacter sp.]|uniref:hypothetical protein n=1 Tax=Mucilaginibacter sp. TaxID=1882438 RepID=UPI002608D44A|nr:hypothetical protein [Mucilaginibacter sp.]
MIKKVTLFLYALMFVALGCKLDKSVSPGGADSLKTTGGTSGNTVDSYQPATKGTYWKYSATIMNTQAQPPVNMTELQTTTMTGATITINNKVYYTANSVVDTMKGYVYFYHGNNTYSYRSNLISPDVVVEYVYLKDNAAVGVTWTSPITDSGKINGTPAQIVGSIIEKDISITLAGKTFTNVTHTQLLLQYDTGTGFSTFQNMDYYIAKGIGIIRIYTKNIQFSTTTSNNIITDYTVK